RADLHYAERYCQQQDSTIKHRPRHFHRQVISLQDNEKLHVAKKTRKKLTDWGWKPLDHQPYSSDACLRPISTLQIISALAGQEEVTRH
ncbi:hypothetical protein KIN20_017308, partial [Parelaphostrongylus tenuis]